jgi:hypothetical protein
MVLRDHLHLNVAVLAFKYLGEQLQFVNIASVDLAACDAVRDRSKLRSKVQSGCLRPIH